MRLFLLFCCWPGLLWAQSSQPSSLPIEVSFSLPASLPGLVKETKVALQVDASCGGILENTGWGKGGGLVVSLGDKSNQLSFGFGTRRGSYHTNDGFTEDERLPFRFLYGSLSYEFLSRKKRGYYVQGLFVTDSFGASQDFVLPSFALGWSLGRTPRGTK